MPSRLPPPAPWSLDPPSASPRRGARKGGGGKKGKGKGKGKARTELWDIDPSEYLSIIPLLLKSHLRLCQESRAHAACLYRRGAIASDHYAVAKMDERGTWYHNQTSGQKGHGMGSPDIHLAQAVLVGMANSETLYDIGEETADEFRELVQQLLQLSISALEMYIPLFTRKEMADRRLLLKYCFRLPRREETLIFEVFQHEGVSFFHSREPPGYMESQLSLTAAAMGTGGAGAAEW